MAALRGLRLKEGGKGFKNFDPQALQVQKFYCLHHQILWGFEIKVLMLLLQGIQQVLAQLFFGLDAHLGDDGF